MSLLDALWSLLTMDIIDVLNVFSGVLWKLGLIALIPVVVLGLLNGMGKAGRTSLWASLLHRNDP